MPKEHREERVINGVLSYRTNKDSKFEPYDALALTLLHGLLELKYKSLRAKYNKLKLKLGEKNV